MVSLQPVNNERVEDLKEGDVIPFAKRRGMRQKEAE